MELDIERIKRVFDTHGALTELYCFERGEIFIKKADAEKQAKVTGTEFETVTRGDDVETHGRASQQPDKQPEQSGEPQPESQSKPKNTKK